MTPIANRKQKETIPVSVYLGEHLAAIVEFADGFDLVGFVFSLRGSKATLQGTGGYEGFPRDLTLTVDGDLPAVLRAASKIVRLFDLSRYGEPNYTEKLEWTPGLPNEVGAQAMTYELGLGSARKRADGQTVLPCKLHCGDGRTILTDIPYDELTGTLLLSQPKETTI